MKIVLYLLIPQIILTFCFYTIIHSENTLINILIMFLISVTLFVDFYCFIKAYHLLRNKNDTNK